MNESTALLVHDAVRKHFKMQGFKSANKVYSASPAARLSDADFATEVAGNAFGTNEGYAERYIDASLAEFEMLEHQVRTRSKIPYQVGALIQRDQIGSGNCYEMACHAAYLASDKHGVNTENLKIGFMSGVANHSFCIYSNRLFPNGTISELISDADFAPAIVIDPWLNVVCFGAEFEDAATEKFNKWSASGKRIGTQLPQGEHAWSNPGGAEYQRVFFSTEVVFKLAGYEVDL